MATTTRNPSKVTKTEVKAEAPVVSRKASPARKPTKPKISWQTIEDGQLLSFGQVKDLHTSMAHLSYKERASVMPKYIALDVNEICNAPAYVLNDVLQCVFESVHKGFSTPTATREAVHLGIPLLGGKRQWNSKIRPLRKTWELIASKGFTDHVAGGYLENWYKPTCYVAPPPQLDYAYSVPADIMKWDTNKVYSHMLGSLPHFFQEQLANTPWFKSLGVTNIVEPMAASAELCYFGHFTNPDLVYSMLDLDESTQTKVLAQEWLPQTRKEYVRGNVLDPKAWDKLKLLRKSKGASLCFIGKQSHNLLNPEELRQFLDLCLTHCDYVVLECMEYTKEMFTTPPWHSTTGTPLHLKEDNITVSLDVDPKGRNNRISFESNLSVTINAPDKKRVFIEYPTWHCYTPSEIVHHALACQNVTRQGIWFQSDFNGNYEVLDSYNPVGGRGSITAEDSVTTAGAIVMLALSRLPYAPGM